MIKILKRIQKDLEIVMKFEIDLTDIPDEIIDDSARLHSSIVQYLWDSKNNR